MKFRKIYEIKKEKKIKMEEKGIKKRENDK